jgi:hypothetical protein
MSVALETYLKRVTLQEEAYRERMDDPTSLAKLEAWDASMTAAGTAYVAALAAGHSVEEIDRAVGQLLGWTDEYTRGLRHRAGGVL